MVWEAEEHPRTIRQASGVDRFPTRERKTGQNGHVGKECKFTRERRTLNVQARVLSVLRESPRGLPPDDTVDVSARENSRKPERVMGDQLENGSTQGETGVSFLIISLESWRRTFCRRWD